MCMCMSSKNISIREEVYEYLKSIKREDESFSDIILKLKKQNTSDGNTLLNIASKYRKSHDKKYWAKRDKEIKNVRKNFSKSIK